MHSHVFAPQKLYYQLLPPEMILTGIFPEQQLATSTLPVTEAYSSHGQPPVRDGNVLPVHFLQCQGDCVYHKDSPLPV